MIVGAGLAGLIAAYAFPRREVFEAAPEPTQSHKALLRFRSTAVSDLTGIEFRPVIVRKAIHDGTQEVAPTIEAANLYSLKCLGRVVPDRSVWKLEPVTRFIAPEDLYDQLIEGVGKRAHWNVNIQLAEAARETTVISTIPLDITCKQLGINPGVALERSPITVMRFRVTDCDVFQTIYFPFPNTSMYRASITGDMMIVEFAGQPEGEWMQMLDRAFGPLELNALEEVKQKYGKIAPIDPDLRKALVARITTDHGIFSLGRFATWRNLLLDDVVQDAAVVKKLINASEHDRRLASI